MANVSATPVKKTGRVRVKGFHHSSVVISDLDRATRFYRDVLGLEPIPRPNFSTPGAWFACPDGTAINIKVGRHVVHPESNTHIALELENYEEALEVLKGLGVRFAGATMIEDPDGNKIELRPAAAQRPSATMTRTVVTDA